MAVILKRKRTHKHGPQVCLLSHIQLTSSNSYEVTSEIAVFLQKMLPKCRKTNKDEDWNMMEKVHSEGERAPWQLAYGRNKCFNFSRCVESRLSTLFFRSPQMELLRHKHKAMYYALVNPAIYSLWVVDLLTKAVPVYFSNHETKLGSINYFRVHC